MSYLIFYRAVGLSQQLIANEEILSVCFEFNLKCIDDVSSNGGETLATKLLNLKLRPIAELPTQSTYI